MPVDDSTTPLGPRARQRPERIWALVGRSHAVADLVVHLGTRTTLGRDRDNHVRLAYDGVSRHHAEIEVAEDGTVWLRDLGSTNGTVVEGQRVSRRTIAAGDVVEVGVVELELVRVTAAELERLEAAASSRAATLRLTPREREVAGLVAAGMTSAAIAEQLGIAVRTVNTHLERIYERLGVRSRVSLATLLGSSGHPLDGDG